MTLRTSLLIQFALLALSLVLGVYYAMTLPSIVPTHFNIHNQPDQYGSKWVAVLMGPCFMLFCIGLTVAIPRLSPKNFEIERFTSTFAYSMVLVAALQFYIAIIISRATAGAHIDILKGLMAGMFMFFALLGNVVGRVKRNFYMGVRTPWTLANEQVWDATHRLAGKLWFIGGLIGAALSLMGAPFAVSMTLIMGMALWPVIASYFIYKKLS